MQMSTEVLVWMTIGIALLSSEAFTGTFHLLFFGLSALFVAALTSMGLSPLVMQLVVFALMSVSSVFLVRKKLIVRSVGFDPDKTSLIHLENDIEPGHESLVHYQGAPWTAKNIGSITLKKDQKAKIVRTEGIKLLIEGE